MLVQQGNDFWLLNRKPLLIAFRTERLSERVQQSSRFEGTFFRRFVNAREVLLTQSVNSITQMGLMQSTNTDRPFAIYIRRSVTWAIRQKVGVSGSAKKF